MVHIDFQELARRWYGGDGIVPRQTENRHRCAPSFRTPHPKLDIDPPTGR